MKNMKTAAGMLCLAGILSLGMGTTVFAEDGDSHYPVTITTYNYENEPVEMTFEKAPFKKGGVYHARNIRTFNPLQLL